MIKSKEKAAIASFLAISVRKAITAPPALQNAKMRRYEPNKNG
jgi:hypothetical protein